MKTVNLGNSFTRRLSLRLNDEQFNFLCDVSKLTGLSPSEFLRTMVNTSMYSQRSEVDKLLHSDYGYEKIS